MLIDWYEPTAAAILGLWQGFLVFIPKLTGSLLVFLIGWIIAAGLGKLVAEILRKLGLNSVFEKESWKEAIEKAELKIDVAGFIGAIFKWVLVIVFLLAAIEILGLRQFADFIVSVLNYLPNVLVAAIMFVVAIIIADFLEKITKASVERVWSGYGNLLGTLVRWSIWIFAVLTILYQLKIAPELILILFTGVVALITVAGGIAFGIGGKDIAAEFLSDIKKKLEKK
ncbi:MAG: hypothetical protein WCZ99_03645 [Candidatus Paceibacterota bacterium]|jgi:hypothetical protein|nr:hypothetical protein [Candidatus Paceibacterota bacterium]MDD3072375.1 hypothetical protein [Candidatus Paceibacterota bacterium]MDD4201757.1 hypothetical protein [Candidatus Paceibacterota bacterium]MDD4467041.1 hypothetical protein [Candidatus Paceibacterota bacterium]MDD4897268.1 hypothetical protein [Candidatus Paceibacterota bacterium]